MSEPTPAAASVLSAYDGASRGTRLHVRGRWRSCPFVAVAAEVPSTGRVLDVGCGHGVLSLLLAVTGPGRTVTGVDVDVEKLVDARQAADRAGVAVAFDPAPAAGVPAGPWDAITIVDVLYLLGAVPAEALLTAAAEALAPGGVLVVKEIDVRPRWKHALARVQEIVATRVLRITEGSEVDFVPPTVLAAAMERSGLIVEQRRVDRGYLHPHHLLLGRRPPTP